MRKPKEYPIPAKELTKLLKACKSQISYNYSRCNNLADLEKVEKFDEQVNHFFHFNCGVKLSDLTTENVLNDKFKI